MNNNDLRALRFVHKHKTKRMPKHLAKRLWAKLLAMAERDPKVIQWAHLARDNYLLALRLAKKDDAQTASFEKMFGFEGHGYEGVDDGQSRTGGEGIELPEPGDSGGGDVHPAGA